MPKRAPHFGPWFVYVLRDPLDRTVRYVGLTKKSPERRLSEHYHDGLLWFPAKLTWLTQLKSAGLRPEVEVVETILVGNSAFARGREDEWISAELAKGSPLVNIHRSRPRLPPDAPGERLRVFAEARCLSRADVAAAIGAAPPAVGSWMLGLGRPSKCPDMEHRARIEAFTGGLIRSSDWGPPTRRGPKPKARHAEGAATP